WGSYPNPNGYSTSHTLHADFESRFVREHATLAAVVAHMRPLATSSAPIAAQIGTYLAASASQVVPLYALDKRGAFANATPQAIDFVDARLADSAAEFRDLVVDAWLASTAVKVGYPDAITPAQVESGSIVPTRKAVDASD
ncbi:MAG: S1/P1 Nuclease, partial [Candidatus Eremiobacteraeota bacterium]|nr:S1/P1 Nuclease [Candidatus Eremiobacteraeota bacterium]